MPLQVNGHEMTLFRDRTVSYQNRSNGLNEQMALTEGAAEFYYSFGPIFHRLPEGNPSQLQNPNGTFPSMRGYDTPTDP